MENKLMIWLEDQYQRRIPIGTYIITSKTLKFWECETVAIYLNRSTPSTQIKCRLSFIVGHGMIENRPTGSGFNSFLRWFKKNEKLRAIQSIDNNRSNKTNGKYESNETLSPPSSPILDNKSFCSSCDSVFSTATTGFAFVSPTNYQSYGDFSQPEKLIAPGPLTETYKKRVKQQENIRETDRKLHLTLRRKYQLFHENETNLKIFNDDKNLLENFKYSEYSLPNVIKKYAYDDEDDDANVNKNAKKGIKKCRRTVSDSSKEKISGAYVHVKGKRKAPDPPVINDFKNLSSNHQSSISPLSTLGRKLNKKRKAPQPPVIIINNDLSESVLKEGVLEDEEFKTVIESSRNSFSKQLTEQQKQTVLDNIIKVSRNLSKSDSQTVTVNNHFNSEERIFFNDTLKLEKGMLKPTKEEKKIDETNAKGNQPPSSPISPRPWYKRPLSGSRDISSIPFRKEIVLKTVDKRRSKGNGKPNSNHEKDLPEVGFSRNSIFENASKLAFFGGSEKQKKVDNQDKRKSGIGIPSISELDRQAAEIVHKEHATAQARILEKSDKYYATPEHIMLESQIIRNTNPREDFPIDMDDEDSNQKTTKDLITKFESTSNAHKVSINTSFIGRNDLFTNNKEKIISQTGEVIGTKLEKPNVNNLLGLWTCPFCTLQNPNWRIICEVCEKIKPYDLRFNKNPTADIKTITNTIVDETPIKHNASSEWEKKAEKVRKYFNFNTRNGKTLSKSSSENSLGKSNEQKIDTLKNYGSPKIGVRDLNSNDRPDLIKTQTSLDETKLSTLNKNCNDLLNSRDVLTTRITTVCDPNTIVTVKNTNTINQSDPNIENIRKARLSHFETNVHKTITSQDDVEKEKLRLREMIRQMNARALAEKYPVVQKSNEDENPIVSNVQSNTPSIVGVLPKINQQAYNDASKLGAIKKLFARKENSLIAAKQQCGKLNLNLDTNPDDSILLTTILSESQSVKNNLLNEKDVSQIKLNKNISANYPIYENIRTNNIRFTEKENETVDEITEQLKSQKGLEDFKATLRSTSKSLLNNSSTLAINKILRNLELAIAEGEYDTAASLAKELARMKVSLSVTRQKHGRFSDVDITDENIIINLYMEDKLSKKEPCKVTTKPSMSISELKTKIMIEHGIPIQIQSFVINDQLVTDSTLSLLNYGITQNGDSINLHFTVAPEEKINDPNTSHFVSNIRVIGDTEEISDSENDNSESQNLKPKYEVIEDDLNKDNEEEGAKGNISENTTNIAKGWGCSLCTLFNSQNNLDCLACSQPRPADCTTAESDQDIIHSPNILRINQFKNDLNKTQNTNRKSTEILNIKGEEPLSLKLLTESATPLQARNYIKRPSNTSIVMTVLNNPNITRNKYRGVDNFNPKFTPFKPLEPIKPVEMKSMESIPHITQHSPEIKNHYHELLKLDTKEVISNKETFECPICFMKFNSGEGVVLRECLHMFCKECLEHTIKYSEDVEIKCPFMDAEYSCESILQEREVKSLVTAEIYEDHLTKSVQQAEHKIENAFHCKTPNCRGWCIYEDKVNLFKCPVCCINNCLTCQAIHDGLDCKQYQDRINSGCDTNLDARRTKEMLQDMLDKGEAMNCPTCKVVLMKKWGCDWLRCSMCKTEICWVTRGPRWGPGGKGDITAGCKCGVNKIKCHKECNYCH